MARPAKDHDAAADLGRRLTNASEATGKPTPKDIELWIYKEYGVRISDESIRQAHRGTVDPNSCSLELLVGLAQFYGLHATDLGPVAARRLVSLVRMADQKALMGTTPITVVLAAPNQTALAVA